MKRRIQNSEFRIQNGMARLLLFCILAAPAFASSQNNVRFERTFADAVRAYDENRLPDAIRGWQALVDEGQDLPEVLFNLGNACYRNGNLGPAIRAYRQAQLLAPRDPDIRANLGFAAQSAGIVLPARKPLAALLLDASRAEWLAFGSACFWLLALAAGTWMLLPRYRYVARPAAALFAVLLLPALAGLGLHRDLRRNPECVVMESSLQLLSSPLETSTPLLEMPEGTVVRKLDERGSWLEVRADATRGWVPAAAVAPVR